MRILYAVATVIVLAALTIAGYVIHWHHVEKQHADAASKIMIQVRTWRLNRTAGREVEKLAAAYKDFSSVEGDCDDICHVRIKFALWSEKLRSPLAFRLRIRPSDYSFDFDVKNGKFTTVFFRQLTSFPNGEFILFRISQAHEGDRRYEGDRRMAWGRMPHVTSPPPGGRALEQEYMPGISDLEWEQIMQFNFECATRWSPCAKVRDYMPTAWQQYADWSRQHHWQPIQE